MVIDLKINLERSGGILGSVSSRTIDTDKLSKSQVTELKELLTHSDFFKLSSLRSNVGSQKVQLIITPIILRSKMEKRNIPLNAPILP